MSKRSLKQAVYLATSGKSRDLSRASRALDGKPVGGWPETRQARMQLRDDLPLQSQRAYTVDEFISAMYTVDSSDRYRSTVEVAS